MENTQTSHSGQKRKAEIGELKASVKAPHIKQEALSSEAHDEYVSKAEVTMMIQEALHVETQKLLKILENKIKELEVEGEAKRDGHVKKIKDYLKGKLSKLGRENEERLNAMFLVLTSKLRKLDEPPLEANANNQGST